MMSVRLPAVAGAFYPAEPVQLAREVQSYLAAARLTPLVGIKALLAPHAGYIYSGEVAAQAYAQLASQRERLRRVVMLGPAHRVLVHGLALSSAEQFVTPLGRVRIEPVPPAVLADLPQLSYNDAAHAGEHSLEVQLPFLQTLLGDFTLLPMVVGSASALEVAAVLDQFWGGDETLIVISSDLSHYQPYADARQHDLNTLRRLLALDGSLNHQDACGATPLSGLLLAARQRGLQLQLLEYRNSGDTAGDKARVVGYAAVAFCAAQGEGDAPAG